MLEFCDAILDIILGPIHLILHYLFFKKKDPKQSYDFKKAKFEKTVQNENTYGIKRSFSENNKPYNEIILQAKVNTVFKAWKYSAQKNGDGNCFGTREVFGEEDEQQKNGKIFKKLSLGDYKWISYQEAYATSLKFGRGLRKLGLKPGDKLAIYAETRQEWITSTFGAFSQNITVCTLYTNLGVDAVAHGINETEVTTVITSHDLMDNMAKMISQCPKVETVIYFKSPIFNTDSSMLQEKVGVSAFETVIALGEEQDYDQKLDVVEPGPDDIAIIMYTSGSTGNPKGVMLSHNNIVNTAMMIFHLIHFNSKQDVYIAYLPLAHIFELCSECTMAMVGIPIGFSSPNTLNDHASKIKRGEKGDSTLLKPTILCAVPLMLDRIYKNILDVIGKKSANLQAAFSFAMEYKKFWREQGYETPMMDRIFFNPIKQVLGGRLRFILSGGAPLSPETELFVRTCLDLDTSQGYSMTETCCSGTGCLPTDPRVGLVGPPFAGCEIRLIDWEEGNYRVTDKPNPRGEIVIGSHSISKGYFKNPEKTAEEYFEENGTRFFKSGDIGEIDKEGTLKIIDRKKDLVKLQHGEYVSLGKVESQLKNHPVVENLCIYGDSMKYHTIAVVCPNQSQLEDVAKELSVDTSDFSAVCQSQAIKDRIAKMLMDHGKKSGLEKFEIPTKVFICSNMWTPESGLVTAAFKIKRKEIVATYKEEIEKLYA